MSSHVHADSEFQEIASLTDSKTVIQRRAARKGVITRAEKHLSSVKAQPIHTVNTHELEKKLEELLRSIHLYDALQSRYEVLSDASGVNIDGEVISADRIRQNHENLLTNYNNYLTCTKLHQEGRVLTSCIEDYEDTDSLTECLSELQALKLKVDEFQRATFSYADTELPAMVDDQRKRMRRLLSKARESSTITSTPASGSTPSISRPSITHKLKLPTFSGRVVDWQPFWNVFAASIKGNTELDSSQKALLLIGAMGSSESKMVAQTAAGPEMSYDRVISALRQRYERKRVVYSEHLRSALCTSAIDYRYKDISDAILQIQTDSHAMQHCRGWSAEQILAARLEERFTDKLQQRWATYASDLEAPPDLAYVITFLEKQLPGLPNDEKAKYPPKTPSNPSHKPKAYVYRAENNRTSSCPACKGPFHPLFTCETFKAWEQGRRQDLVRSLKLCNNCLSNSHTTRDCPSQRYCRTCSGRHHSLLHRQTAISAPQQPPVTVTNSANAARIQLSSPASLLSTALVSATHGRTKMKARALLDTGATISLISSRMVNALQLRKIPHRLEVVGLGGEKRSNYCVDVRLSSSHTEDEDDDYIVAHCHVVDDIMPIIPCKEVKTILQLPLLQDKHPLADPGLGGPVRIDILLGVSDVNRAFRDEIVQSSDRSLLLSRTLFGWTVSGEIKPTSNQAIVMRISEKKTDQLLERLWEREETPKEQAVNCYLDSYQRLPDGRYSVSLPRRDPAPQLGESRPTALQRFLSNERSLQRKNKLQPFNDVLQEYEDLGHAEPVSAADLQKPPKDHFYLPMHGVVKESSTTTKLRVVFDASAKSASGVSLNDQLLPTPSLYPLLTSVLIKFRMHRVALTADVSKMFREVVLDPSERDFHRFLRRSKGGEIIDWRMKRLTFGVASSPYLASQVLQQTATDHFEDYPEAAAVVRDTFYVDDCLTGASTPTEAIELHHQLYNLLKKSGMTLRKWRTNSPEVLQVIPEELREKDSANLVISDPTECAKTLGVHWQTSSDELFVAVPDLDDTQPTKRIVASAVARLYDILGWYSPITLSLKILLQQLWLLKLNWDDPIPEAYVSKWQAWKADLESISRHPISRCFLISDSPIQEMQLHGFADASQSGYGGVVYLRILYQDTSVSVSLVTSKTRVSPLKVLTIPKLELAGALLTARLLVATARDLNLPRTNLFAWTDSSIVLGWLSRTSTRWKVFVSNRVSEIQELVPSTQWHHVPTSQNPADHASRGLRPDEMLRCDLWWKGPLWLRQSPDHWPPPLNSSLTDDLPETRAVLLTAALPELPVVWSNFSSLKHCLRVLSWCFRFVSRARQKASHRSPAEPHLTQEELDTTQQAVLRYCQQQTFPDAILLLSQGKSLPQKHLLSSLHPFLGEKGLLRVGGRLNRAQLPECVQNPIILHHSSYLVKMLCLQIHKTSGHPGPGTLLALIAERYYIIGSRRLVKAISKTCVPCQKAYARVKHQLMGQLPPQRIQPAPPFSRVGVDFAGPFNTIRGNPRKPILVKTYACLFICLATKAIHIETCADLSTDTFVAAIQRFSARRGYPQDVFCDNGKNFVGASKELSDVTTLLQSTELGQKVSHLASDFGIRWHFIPARSPHFGGFWESGVRLMKVQLRKLVGSHRLSFEQLNTILIEVEAMLNSRPLLPLDLDSTDGPRSLTPGHFIIGRPIKAIPVRTNVHSNITYLRRWNLVKRLSADLWLTWHSRYLQSLQSRSKWNTTIRNFRIGDVVLLKDESLVENRDWPIAIITDVKLGRDGVVRVVDLRLRGHIYRRGVDRLVLLVPFEDDVDRGEDVGDQATDYS